MSAFKKITTLVVVSSLQSVCSPALAADLFGAGSTFVLPVFSKWMEAYTKTANVSIDYRAVGSINGVWLVKGEMVDFAASDAVLRTEDAAALGVVQFPLVVGGVVPVVNLKGIGTGQLKLTGPIIADIFLGKITRWNHKMIADLNPSLMLPDQVIVPVYRFTDSGTRYIFADYLAKVSPEWKRDVAPTVSIYPHSVGIGNQRVADFILERAGAIGYVEFAYAKQNGLTFPLLKNRDGEFVAPSAHSFRAAMLNSDWLSGADFNMTLTDKPGKESWPISGATYLVINKKQRNSTAATQMPKFFQSIYGGGSALAAELGYVPVPDNVVKVSEQMWSGVKLPDGRPARQ